ncbi:hypothetical protein ACWPKS_02425 [Coraliomargarita sp. W4R72]
MNEHIRIRRVVEGLRSHLKSKDFGDEFRSSIASYNNSCRLLKQRLQQVDAILLSGNVSGALKLAETDPSVLDLLTLLGFPESQDLKDWCVANGVSFEGRFEEVMIHRLNEAYSANRETDTQLEKEYRKAILKKDYASALPIARTVARLQPNDTAAQTELRNTERRYAKQLESKLDAVVHRGEIDAVQKLLMEFDNLRCEDYAGGAVIREARDLVQKKNNADGISKISELIEAAPQTPKLDDWEAFEAIYDSILEIKGTLTVPLPPELETTWAEFCLRERDFRGKVTRTNSQRIALEKLKGVVNHAQTSRVTGQATELKQAQSSLEALLSAARNAESLDATIVDELQARWREEVTFLRERVGKMQKALRYQRMGIATVIVLALISISLLGYFYARSSNIVSEADTILAGKDLSGARAFVNAKYPEEWLLAYSQSVKARNERLRQFIETDEADASILSNKIRSFEENKDEWSQGMRPMAFADGELKALYANLQELSQESGRPVRLELDRLENELSIIRNAFGNDLVQEVELKLKEMEESVMPQLSLTNPPEKLLQGLEQASQSISEVAAIDARGQGVITMSADQKLRVESFEKARNRGMLAVESHHDFMEELTNAPSVDAYYELVSRGMTVEYLGSPLYQSLTNLPKSFDEGIFRKAAFSSLPLEFTRLISAGTLAPLSPPSALLPKEVDAYAEFRFNELVEGIQFHELTVPNPVRRVRVYSRGDLEDEGRFSTGDYMRSYISGSFYFPHVDKGAIKFADYDSMLVSDFTSYGDLPELAMLEALDVGDLLSSQREVISNASNPAPFLRLIDEIHGDSSASDDYKCFAIVQLFDMMDASSRPEQWGLSYLPNWRTEVDQLRSLGVQNGDWLKESASRQLPEATQLLGQFFKGLSIEKLSRVNQEFIKRTLDTKVQFYGFLPTGESDALSHYVGIQAYALASGSNKWLEITANESVSNYLPLSPVLSVSEGQIELYTSVCEELGLDTEESAIMAMLSGFSTER